MNYKVILIHNEKSKKQTDDCLDSLLEDGTPRKDIIIYDGGQVHPFNYNKALNQAYQTIQNKPDVTFFCNNDLIFDTFSIRKMISCMGTYKLDSVSPFYPNWQFHKPMVFNRTGIKIGMRTGHELIGWCIGVTSDFYNKIGGFDEFPKFWTSDNSYERQLRIHDGKHALVKNAIVHHVGSVTLKQLKHQDYLHLTLNQVDLYNAHYNENLFGRNKKLRRK